MCTTALDSIKFSLIALFKKLFPTFDVFCEEISRTQGEDERPTLEDYVFLDIIPSGNETINPYHTRRTILVDAAVHTQAESNGDYLRITPQIDGAIRPAFYFEDNGESRVITVPDISFAVVDKVLHCTFTLSFTDSVEEPPPLPVMEELFLS